MSFFEPMWTNFEVNVKRPDGITVEIGPCEMYYPRRADSLGIEISIPREVMEQVDEEHYPDFVAKTLRSIAGIVDSPIPKSRSLPKKSGEGK